MLRKAIKIFLNLPSLTNFHPITGLSGTYYRYNLLAIYVFPALNEPWIEI